jgi:integrase
LMETAVRSMRLSANPAVGVKLPRAGKPEKTFLTHEQVSALADAAGKPKVTTPDLQPSPEAVRLAEERRTIILVLSYCGLRWGEVAALRVERVDTMRRRITVAEAVSEVRGKLVWGHRRRINKGRCQYPSSLLICWMCSRLGRDQRI